MSTHPAWRAAESGGGQRDITAVNGNDDPSLGITLGKDVERKFGLEKNDVCFLELHPLERKATIYFSPERND